MFKKFSKITHLSAVKFPNNGQCSSLLPGRETGSKAVRIKVKCDEKESVLSELFPLFLSCKFLQAC